MNRAKEILHELVALLTLAFFAGPAPSAFAALGYMTEDDMVRRAEIIAIVDISHVERVKTNPGLSTTTRLLMRPSDRRSRELCHKP
jgi:hypothetical protein